MIVSVPSILSAMRTDRKGRPGNCSADDEPLLLGLVIEELLCRCRADREALPDEGQAFERRPEAV